MAAPPPPPRGGMSLYANLLDPKADSSSAASISSAPVLYGQSADAGKSDAAAAKKPVDPALRFQPIRRPQVKAKTTKPAFPKAMAPAGAPAPAPQAAPAAAPAPAAQPRSTLADWAATEEDEYLYGTGEKRQRGGRRAKNKKKKQQQQAQEGLRETDWDELYDPARPTNVDEYLRSDERIREVREWKAVLYAHRRRRGGPGSRDSDEGDDDDWEESERRPGFGNQFAPPPEYAFAPPPPSPPRAAPPSAAAAAAPPPPNETADEAYARRLALSGMAPAPPPRAADSPVPPAPPSPILSHAEPAAHPPPAPPPPAAPDGATISRGPVRYEAPPPPPGGDSGMDVDEDEDEGGDYGARPAFAPDGDGDGDAAMPNAGTPGADGQPRYRRPGQPGFAQRLMSKYGWTAGTGLGADASGIVNPLRVQVEKRRKRPDAEGGGYAEPGGRGRIIGGKRAAPDTTTPTGGGTSGGTGGGGGSSKFGPASQVVCLAHMLDGVADVEAEVASGELAQEIGDECGDKYGRVERVYVDVGSRRVFIKFTDAVSALRAVNALEGRAFGGAAIAARFYDADRFEEGVYS